MRHDRLLTYFGVLRRAGPIARRGLSSVPGEGLARIPATHPWRPPTIRGKVGSLGLWCGFRSLRGRTKSGHSAQRKEDPRPPLPHPKTDGGPQQVDFVGNGPDISKAVFALWCDGLAYLSCRGSGGSPRTLWMEMICESWDTRSIARSAGGMNFWTTRLGVVVPAAACQARWGRDQTRAKTKSAQAAGRSRATPAAQHEFCFYFWSCLILCSGCANYQP